MTPHFLKQKYTTMYKQNKAEKTTLLVNTSYEGETIEQKVNRIVNNKEPIKDGAPTIYTDRRDGVQPQYDIRTDRFEVALDATDLISKTHISKRQEFHTEKTIEENNEKNMGEEIENLRSQVKTLGEQKTFTGGEPIQATDNNDKKS